MGGLTGMDNGPVATRWSCGDVIWSRRSPRDAGITREDEIARETTCGLTGRRWVWRLRSSELNPIPNPPMNRFHDVTQFVPVLWAIVFASAAAAEKPNIIVILADDLGYSDVGCFGGEIATPAIDKLAEEGLRLPRFSNGGMCVISRAAMLTGKWWPRALPEFAETRLLPERLQDAGYRTGLIGKWHLDGDPMDRGFDHFFGFLNGFTDHFTGSGSYRLDREPFTRFGPDYYSSDQFSERAIQFIESPSKENKQKPFFLYLSYQAPHNPLQAPKEDFMKYRGKYAEGWQAVRDQRFRRQQEMGIVGADAVLPAYPENLPAWDSLTAAQRDLEDLRMAVYAAMVERMDRGIGRVMNALEASGQADNTMVLFLSDNGTDPFSVVDDVMLKLGKLPGERASNWQPGTGWAYASVTPWRLYKISQHAGGVITGAVAWWPGGKIKPGHIDFASVNLIDLMPTCLEMAGGEIDPEETAGKSFVSLLKGGKWSREKPLFFQYMDNRAIRTSEWTLAEVDGAGWELFDVRMDPLEVTDLATDHPDVVADLDRRWLEWWKNQSGEVGYTPVSTATGPHYKPQGDHGSGVLYQPRAMPAALADRYPAP